jgi:hypothetical protein
MRLPRMTTRRWMVFVVVVGLLMGGVQLKRRHDDLVGRAEFHNRMAATWIGRGVAALNDPILQRFIAYHGSLARKYWYAARYPWLPVEPEPPEPPGRPGRKR